MRAWVLDGGVGLDHLRLREVPEPVPGPGEVRLRVRAVSLNQRDLRMIEGRYLPKLPPALVPGSDVEGVIDAVGAGVTGWTEGQRAIVAFHPTWIDGAIPLGLNARTLGGPLDGSLRELMVVPAAGLVAPPVHLSPEEAATLPCAGATAWRALMVDGGVRPGSVVLTQGTGGVSLFAVQIGAMAGARVVLTSSSLAKAEVARPLGAAHLLSYVDEPGWGAAVKAWTGGVGADLVVELGGAATLEQSLRCVRPGGTIALIGVLGGGQAQVTLARVFMHGVRVQGILVGSRADLEGLVRALEAHPEVRPVLGGDWGFEDVPAAFARLATGGHVGKLVVRVGA